MGSQKALDARPDCELTANLYNNHSGEQKAFAISLVICNLQIIPIGQDVWRAKKSTAIICNHTNNSEAKSQSQMLRDRHPTSLNLLSAKTGVEQFGVTISFAKSRMPQLIVYTKRLIVYRKRLIVYRKSKVAGERRSTATGCDM